MNFTLIGITVKRKEHCQKFRKHERLDRDKLPITWQRKNTKLAISGSVCVSADVKCGGGGGYVILYMLQWSILFSSVCTQQSKASYINKPTLALEVQRRLIFLYFYSIFSCTFVHNIMLHVQYIKCLTQFGYECRAFCTSLNLRTRFQITNEITTYIKTQMSLETKERRRTIEIVLKL
jgi:hypothetical protein